MASDSPDQANVGSGSLPDQAPRPKRGPGRPRQDPRIRPTQTVDGPAGGTKDATSEAEVDAREESKALAAPPIEGNPTFVRNRRSHRDRIAEWVLLRSQGLKNAEIANRMGIQLDTLHTLIGKATRQGWLKFESPADRLEFEIAPKVVDNINGFIDARDKQVTLEVAKGLGLLKTHQALKVEGDGAPAVIAIKIDMIEPTTVRSGGMIVGTPKLPTIEGRIVKPEPETGSS